MRRAPLKQPRPPRRPSSRQDISGGKIALKSWLADGDAGYWTL